MPNIRWLLALITRVHRFLYRATGGRIGARAGGVDVLLLTHVGRKSGRVRTIPLLYVSYQGDPVVVASNAGDDRHPAWWLNLQARPEAQIQIRADKHAVRARRADATETEKLWPVLDASYPAYANYRKATSREIPIVILERA